MAQFTVKFKTDKSVDPAFLENLNLLAQEYDLHIETEFYPPCDHFPVTKKISHEEFIQKANEISQRIGPIESDSTEDIRELRDWR